MASRGYMTRAEDGMLSLSSEHSDSTNAKATENSFVEIHFNQNWLWLSTKGQEIVE